MARLRNWPRTPGEAAAAPDAFRSGGAPLSRLPELAVGVEPSTVYRMLAPEVLSVIETDWVVAN